MSQSAQVPPQYEPSVGVRLLWWFGIYFLGITVCWIDLSLTASKENPHPSGPSLLGPFVILLFPNGLAGTNGLNNFITIPINYLIYIAHLVFTLRVPSRKAFRIALFFLVVLASMSVVGCHEAAINRPHM